MALLAAAALLGFAIAGQAQNAAASGAPVPDKPSDGVLELSAGPQGPRHPLVRSDPPTTDENGRPLWTGGVWLKLTNTTRGTVTVNDGSPEWFYWFEVLDSAGKLVPTTPRGDQLLAWRSDPNSGPRLASTLHLIPLESAGNAVDLAQLFQIKLGYAYTIQIKRTLDSRTFDDKGQPLPPESRELTYTLYVPGKNADQ